MARHGNRPCGPVAGVQVRLATPITSADYVAGKHWRDATLLHCPWHPEGGCGFARHGTYSRVSPPGTLIARWYCPLERCTISALPDCFASHYSGTLVELEGLVLRVEQAASMAESARTLRTDIELPGALRYLNRLCQAIRHALGIVRGLFPDRFAAIPLTLSAFATALPAARSVLLGLRELACGYLPQLPTPLGFNPPRHKTDSPFVPFQHRMGPDPPQAFIDDPT